MHSSSTTTAYAIGIIDNELYLTIVYGHTCCLTFCSLAFQFTCVQPSIKRQQLTLSPILLQQGSGMRGRRLALGSQHAHMSKGSLAWNRFIQFT